jgi:transposase
MNIMREHLSLISIRTQAGRYAVIIVYGVAWHQHFLAEEFANLSIIKLPPYSPELNPIEQVRQWLRQNKLANRCFEGYEDIVEQCSRDWIEVEINYGDCYKTVYLPEANKQFYRYRS